jgi:HK97 family phage portal protein
MKLLDRYLERRLEKMGYASKQKMASFMSSEIESGSWAGRVESTELTNYADFIKAFKALPWLYAGAMAIAVAATKPVLRVYREAKKGGEVTQEEVLGEPVNQLIELPNPFLSYRELIQLTAINLLIPGNAYWNLVGTGKNQPISSSNPPIEIWWLKPEQVEIEADPEKFIKGYVFKSQTGKEVKLDPSEIIQFKTVNPDSYFRGLGAMEAAKNSAILEFNAIAYNKNFMGNDATPNGLFGTDQVLTKEQSDRFLREWDARHKGPKNRGKIDLTWGGIKYQQMAVNPKDAQYAEMRKMNREEMLATLGVPPSIVGLLEYANYSNMEVQQKKFWEDTEIPILNTIADKLTLCLAPHFDEAYWFEFDFSDIRVLQEDEERKSRIAATLITNGIRTPNQVRADMYGDEPYVGGDRYYMPLSMVEVGQEPDAGKAQKRLSKDAQTKREPSFWQGETRQKVLWEDFAKRVGRKERMFIGRLRDHLETQADDVAAKTSRAENVSGVSAIGLLDVEAEAKTYAKKFLGHYMTALKEAGDAGMQIAQGKLYILPEERIMKEEDRFQITPEIRVQLDDMILNSGTEMNKTTLEKISAQIQLGIEEDWTVGELAKNLREKLLELTPAKAQLIARTEAAKVENWGQVEGYKQTEFIELKGWLCSFVPDSRQAHMDASRQYADNPIPLEDSFVVDGEDMQYPGDPSGSPGNVCNCLCSTYPDVRNV